MPWGYAAAAVGSAAIGADAAGDASDASTSATNKQIAEQQRQYNQNRRDQRKYRKAGNKSLKKLQRSDGIGSFEFNLESDPGYQFALDEALRGTSRQFAAQGGRNSGNVLAALSDRGAGMASQYTNDAWNRQFGEYSDRLNRYQALAGLGQTATAQTGNSGMNAANQMGMAYGNNAMNQANAGYYQAGSANNALQGGYSNYLTYDYLNNNQPQTADTYNGNPHW